MSFPRLHLRLREQIPLLLLGLATLALRRAPQ